MPEVFHEQNQFPVWFGEQRIQQVRGSRGHRLAGMAIAQGEQLLVRAVGDVKDHILRALDPGSFNVPAVGLCQGFRRVAAVEGADCVKAAQLFAASVMIAGVKIVPIGKETEVHAHDLLRGHDAANILAAVHELQAVKVPKGGQQIGPIPVAVQIVAVGGQIEGALHGITRSRWRTSVRVRPSAFRLTRQQ